MNIKQLVEDYIEKIKDPKIAEFSKSLIDTRYEIKGTKTRLIDDFAKSLIRINVDFYELPLDNYEEILLAGCVIGKIKASPEEKIKMFKRVLPCIDNWGTCDTIVSRLKGLESQRKFFEDLLKEENPFYVRVGIVWLMKYQLKNDLYNVLALIKTVKNDHFYVKMAIAWCYAEAFAYDYKYMYDFIQKESDVFIRNKTLQKACESFRVKKEDKQALKMLRVKTR